MNATHDEVRRLIAATGKYELHEENTEGASAYTFRALHRPLNQDVFLKVTPTAPDGDLFAEPRLLVEATKTTDGDSNVVRVYDAERLGDEYTLVAMEYVEEGSVNARLASGPLPLMEAIDAAIGILHGVAQLHHALFVHRDIKPANVVLTRRYGRIWPKITDFGSVARLAHVGASVSASRHSPLYVPPEGWTKPGRYDARSDIYQVGLVLFEMAHGPLPQGGDAYLDHKARQELRKLKASTNANDSFIHGQVVERALGTGSPRQGRDQIRSSATLRTQ